MKGLCNEIYGRTLKWNRLGINVKQSNEDKSYGAIARGNVRQNWNN